jgi:GT2 family glycosyltransferase
MSHTAVVILNFNGEKFLKTFLPSVIQHSLPATIVVADNGSTDGSLQLVKEQFPEVVAIPLDNNYGFCGGYNRALSVVNADYYVLLNSDVEVTPQWLSPMVALLDNHPAIAAVQPKILAYHQRDTFEYAGAGGGFIDAWGYPFCRGRILSSLEKDHHQYDDSTPVFWASGACLVIRSSVFHSFGGFDEDFFAHMEEIDLCWKIHRTNMQVWYCGQSVVYHVGAGTLGYATPGKTYLNFRNGLSLIYKHLDPSELWYKLPLRIALEWIAALLFLIKGEGKNFLAVCRAHSHFIFQSKNLRQKRMDVRKAYPKYSRQFIFKGVMAFWYYFKSAKIFTSYQEGIEGVKNK